MVQLQGVQETLLGPLYGRALDARSRRPILNDTLADEAVDRIEYDFTSLGITRAQAPSAALRAKHFDDWTRAFLADHADAVVVHLGAGLDTRVWRVDPDPGVLWFDVDYPDVIELREVFLPSVPQRWAYQTIGASVTADGWLDRIPRDRPALVVAEGLSMYLSPRKGHTLVQRICDHFAGGVIAFDAFNSFGIRSQSRQVGIRRTGARLVWGIDDPHELERTEPRLRLTDDVSALYAPGTNRIALRYRVMRELLRPFPGMRKIGRYLRYEF
jgi:methyltransferase (TIGR00027 family)